MKTSDMTITIKLKQGGKTFTATSEAFTVGKLGLPEEIACKEGVESLVAVAATAVAGRCFAAIQKRDRK